MRQYDLLTQQPFGTGIILCFLISSLGGIYNFVIHVLSPFLILIEQNNMHILALYIASVSPSLIVTDIRKENKFNHKKIRIQHFCHIRTSIKYTCYLFCRHLSKSDCNGYQRENKFIIFHPYF